MTGPEFEAWLKANKISITEAADCLGRHRVNMYYLFKAGRVEAVEIEKIKKEFKPEIVPENFIREHVSLDTVYEMLREIREQQAEILNHLQNHVYKAKKSTSA